MTSPLKPEEWPKAFLLKIHDEAIKNGFIFIEPISLADAISLRQRLYRVRRRADKALAPFILPEYHLVTVGQWESTDETSTLGRLPVIYDQLPSGRSLPGIRPATSAERGDYVPTTSLGPTISNAPLSPDEFLEVISHTDLTLEPDEVSGFVDDLIANAKRKARETPEQ